MITHTDGWLMIWPNHSRFQPHSQYVSVEYRHGSLLTRGARKYVHDAPPSLEFQEGAKDGGLGIRRNINFLG